MLSFSAPRTSDERERRRGSLAQSLALIAARKSGDTKWFQLLECQLRAAGGLSTSEKPAPEGARIQRSLLSERGKSLESSRITPA